MFAEVERKQLMGRQLTLAQGHTVQELTAGPETLRKCMTGLSDQRPVLPMTVLVLKVVLGMLS